MDISNLLFLLLFQGICSQFKAPKVLQNHGKSLQNPYSGVEGGSGLTHGALYLCGSMPEPDFPEGS
jgi:hypothetical protein